MHKYNIEMKKLSKVFQVNLTITNLKTLMNSWGRISFAIINCVLYDLSSKHEDNDEYLEFVNSMERNDRKQEYYYDGVEEILSSSDNEGELNNENDEYLINNDDRISFTREQLVEYQQLTKLLRLVKVDFKTRIFGFFL